MLDAMVVIFDAYFSSDVYLDHFMWNYFWWIPQNHIYDVIIGFGNASLSSGHVVPSNNGRLTPPPLGQNGRHFADAIFVSENNFD